MLPAYYGAPPTTFGIMHPHEGAGRSKALIICQPLLGEAIWTHWALKRIAEWASQSGYDVIRFDYSGTGNSIGDLSDVGVSTWIGDIEQAIDEIEDRFGTTRVTILGVRLGFALAGLLSLRRDVDSLIGWDPVLTGNSWLEDRRGDREVRLDGGFDYQGYHVDERLLAELADLNLQRLDCIEASAVITAGQEPGFPAQQLGVEIFKADDTWNWRRPVEALFYAHDSVRLICERLQ